MPEQGEDAAGQRAAYVWTEVPVPVIAAVTGNALGGGLQIALGGHMPQTDNLPYAWWETPNIHFCSIKDFRQLCGVAGAKMEQAVALNAWGRRMRLKMPWWFWNLFGEQAVFLLSRQG